MNCNARHHLLRGRNGTGLKLRFLRSRTTLNSSAGYTAQVALSPLDICSKPIDHERLNGWCGARPGLHVADFESAI